jgi:hypothetical protein
MKKLVFSVLVLVLMSCNSDDGTGIVTVNENVSRPLSYDWMLGDWIVSQVDGRNVPNNIRRGANYHITSQFLSIGNVMSNVDVYPSPSVSMFYYQESEKHISMFTPHIGGRQDVYMVGGDLFWEYENTFFIKFVRP